VVYVTQPPVQTFVTGTPGAVIENENNVAGAPAGSAAPTNESSESGGRTMNDLGPSYYADALPSGSNTSLGEVSAQFKALKATVNARVLTNDDVHQMVSSKNGVTMAKNMPPLGQGPLEQSGQAQNAGSQPATQSAQSTQQNPQTNASVNQPGQNVANSQGGTPPPAPSKQSAGAGVSAENSTTPQINQNQQSNDAQGSRRLPATATLLPLLGLLGLVSGGIGFWFRKFRK
jgi:cobalamin biosynthesis Mg chelatase CobN